MMNGFKGRSRGWKEIEIKAEREETYQPSRSGVWRCGKDPDSLQKMGQKFGYKEQFDKEQIGVKEPFPLTNLPIYFISTRNI